MRRGIEVLLAWALGVLLLMAGVASAQEGGAPPPVGQGCLMARSPVSGRYEPVPLRHTEVEIDVRGLAASASVVQTYVNDTGRPLEALYVFPLPARAAVYDMEIRIAERRIRSVIKEREEARKTYEAARSEGRRAALVEEERPNVFTASVANVMPGDTVEVRLRYVETLDWDGGTVRLVFPMVVGPRYITGAPVGVSGPGWSFDTDAVPDGSRITPPVRHPDSRPGHDIALTVRLEAGLALDELSSPSHPVHVNDEGGGVRKVTLARERTLPNRDFVLELKRARAEQAGAALFLSPAPDGRETHFMLVAFPPSVKPEDRPPLELLFVIDHSGSMAGTSIEQARAALLQGLDRLRPGDRFDVVAYDHTFVPFRPMPVPATPENLTAGRRFVRGLQAEGGTELLPALQYAMAMPAEPGFLRHIVVLTDGCLGNEEQVFAAVRGSLAGARLFTVAIGSAPNHHLARKMSEYGRGDFTHIADTGEVAEQMGRLLDRIEAPALTDLALEFEGTTATEVYPSRLPDLFLARPLVVYGRLDGGASGHVRLRGRGVDGDFVQDLPFASEAAAFHPAITTLWAREKLEEQMDRWREASGEDAKLTVRAEAVAHAIRHKLVSRFTSLVAVEERIVNPGGDQDAAVVPTELPEGWELDKVFGAPAGGTADVFLEMLGAVLLSLGLLALAARRLPRAARRRA